MLPPYVPPSIIFRIDSGALLGPKYELEHGYGLHPEPYCPAGSTLLPGRDPVLSSLLSQK